MLKEGNTLVHPIILFDGVCNLCNSTVNFIIKRDKKKIFRFSPLQSEFGNSIFKQISIKDEKFKTVVLLVDNTIYIKSQAIIEIVKILGFPWSMFMMFMMFGILPQKIRDVIYVLISKHKYSWFGKRDKCIVPSDELKSRFI